MKERKQPQDPQVKDEPGTQPKKYYKGLSKKEKEARAKQLPNFHALHVKNTGRNLIRAVGVRPQAVRMK